MGDGQKAGTGWSDDHFCFGCGSDNTEGLRLKFEKEGQKLRTWFTPGKRFQGYTDVVHGGMIALVLDETMVNLPWKLLGTPVVSASMEIRFKKPAKVGEKLEFTAEVVGKKKRLFLVKGECRQSDGSLVASASAKCVAVEAANA